MLKIKVVRFVSVLMLGFGLTSVALPSFAAPACQVLFSGKSVLARATRTQLRMAPGRQIDFTFVEAAEDQPTFLFLPGVNRGMNMQDATVQALREFGIGVAAINFSTQPDSVVRLPKGEVPFFKANEMKMADFAAEVDFTIAELRAKGVTNIIPVSLSFSGAVSPLLRNSPVIIDVVPLTDADAALGMGGSLASTSKTMASFWGMGWLYRAQMDAAYRSTWSKQVDGMIKSENLDPARRDDMIDGYTRMSQSTEGYSWNVKGVSRETNRFFVVAEKESPTLLKSQLKTYLEYRELNPDAILFIVKESGHIVLSDQPMIYTTILYQIAKGEIGATSGIIIHEPSTKSVTHIPKEQAKAFIQSLVNK